MLQARNTLLMYTASEVYAMSEKQLKSTVKTAIYDEIHWFRTTGTKVIESSGGNKSEKWTEAVKQWKRNACCFEANAILTKIVKDYGINLAGYHPFKRVKNTAAPTNSAPPPPAAPPAPTQ